MALRNILTMTDPVLRKKSRKVTEFNDRIKQLMDDLSDTLMKVDALGLASPQVGVLRRAVVVLIDEKEILELINPEIIESEGETEIDEACLSCPGVLGRVVRPQRIIVRADDRNGVEFTRELEEVNARVVCHEIDHLDGILLVDVAKEIFADNEEYWNNRKKSEEEDKET